MSAFPLIAKLLHPSAVLGSLALALPINSTFAYASPVPSHCSTTETPVFSCKLQASQKYVSVCASNLSMRSTTSIVYRFGVLGAVEMAFPAEAAGSVRKFKTHHYFRAQVDRRELSFTRSGVTYGVFTNFEGEESRVHRDAGVTVIMPGKTVRRTLRCANPYLDRLEMLDGVVQEGPDVMDDDE